MASTVRRSATRERVEELGDLVTFTGQTLRAVPGSGRYAAESMRQLGKMVRGSTVLIVVMIGFVALSATNYGYYFLKAAGAADYVGLIAGLGGPRAAVALLFGYAFAAKVGCGYVGEIGAMRVNEELDAYESEGVTVQRYIVATRVIASIAYVPIITGLGLLAYIFASYLQAVVVIDAVSPDTFFRYVWANQAITDQVFAFILILVLAITISVVACFYGMRVSGGPAAVGTAVARSLVVNLVAVHVLVGLADALVYGTDLGLPIGG